MMPYTLLVRDKVKMPDLTEFMTTEEAAKALGFTVGSVRNMVYKGSLESIKFGRTLLISRKSVKEYLEETRGMAANDPRRGRGRS